MALETFTRYFFAHDRLNYARMIPVYLADMKSLQKSDASIYDEFLQGNWVVNKNPYVPLYSIGADHGLEQINCAMKVSGGLVGITLNPSARTKFFLISPELARLAGEAQQMAGVLPNTRIHHHDLSTSILERHERNIEKLTSTLRSFTNPFAEDSEDLFNLVTKAVMPDEVQDDLCSQSEIGRMMFDVFVAERIKTGKTNLWFPMKKRRLNTWKCFGKSIRVKSGEQVVELKEDRSLFARMLVVSKSRPDINLKESIGKYEFSVVPRSLFAADGTMLHCSIKSKLMTILEKLPLDEVPSLDQTDENAAGISTSSQSTVTVGIAEFDIAIAKLEVTLVDAMATVQSMGKPEWIKNCSQLTSSAVYSCNIMTIVRCI